MLIHILLVDRHIAGFALIAKELPYPYNLLCLINPHIETMIISIQSSVFEDRTV